MDEESADLRTGVTDHAVEIAWLEVVRVCKGTSAPVAMYAWRTPVIAAGGNRNVNRIGSEPGFDPR
jgi:hypothetical protein